MKKPMGIKIITAIICFRVIVVVFLITLFVLSISVFSTNQFYQVFRGLVLYKLKIENTALLTYRQYGEVMGYHATPIIYLALNLVHLVKRKYKGFRITSIIVAITSFPNILNFILSCMVLVILYRHDDVISYFLGTANMDNKNVT